MEHLDLIIDGTAETFEHDVIEASKHMPVLVLFYDPDSEDSEEQKTRVEQEVRKQTEKLRLVRLTLPDGEAVSGEAELDCIALSLYWDGSRPSMIRGYISDSSVNETIKRAARCAGWPTLNRGDLTGEHLLSLVEKFDAHISEFCEKERLDDELKHTISDAWLLNMYADVSEAERYREILDRYRRSFDFVQALSKP